MTIGRPPAVVTVREFLGLREAAGNPPTWSLTVGRPLVNGLGTLWGGAGLAAAVEVLEAMTGRACVWAAVQYVRPIHAGAEVGFEVEIGRSGGRLSQVALRGVVRGETAMSCLGSLAVPDGPARSPAAAPDRVDAQWVDPPADLPSPEHSAPRSMPLAVSTDGLLLGRIEQRWAQPQPVLGGEGVFGSGHTLVWTRLREPVETTPAALAILADLAPSAIAEALGIPAGGVSLDNTIRIARTAGVEPGAWVLLDLTVESVVGAVAQLSVRLFDRDGRLLAVAGQSANGRRWQPRPPAGRLGAAGRSAPAPAAFDRPPTA